MILINIYRLTLQRKFSSNKYKIFVGAREFIERRITETDVEKFTNLTGDFNPLHSKLSTHPRVHGAFLNGLVSGVIGTKIPGPGTIVVSQTMRFPNPCFLNDSVIVSVEITEVRKIIKCSYVVKKKNDDSIVMEGEAKLIFKV